METVDLGKMTERELKIEHDRLLHADPFRMESEEQTKVRKQRMDAISDELALRQEQEPMLELQSKRSNNSSKRHW